MINKDFYTKKMAEAQILIGRQLPKETVALIYQKIKNDYDDMEFDKAIYTASQEGDISFHNLVRWLNYYKEIRLEALEKKEKEKEKQEIKKLLKEEIVDCKYGRRCNSCPVQYCSILAKFAFNQVIIPILQGEDKIKILKKASEEFPNIWGKVYERYKEK